MHPPALLPQNPLFFFLTLTRKRSCSLSLYKTAHANSDTSRKISYYFSFTVVHLCDER